MRFLKKIYQKICREITFWWWEEELDLSEEEAIIKELEMKELEKNKDM